MEGPDVMRALEAEMVDVLWATIEPLLPEPEQTHPLGCHRPRVSDRLCFRGILIRLTSGSSWSTSKQSGLTRCPTPRCAPDAINGSELGCSIVSRPRSALAMTASSDSISPRSLSTGRSTKHRVAVKEPTRTPLTESETRLEVVHRGRRERHPDRPGQRRSEPQRLDLVGTHPRRGCGRWTPHRCRRVTSRPRLRLTPHPGPARVRWDHRRCHPTARDHGPRGEATGPSQVALDRRSNELVTVELRPTPAQHRPARRPPRRARPRDRDPVVGRLLDYRNRWNPA